MKKNCVLLLSMILLAQGSGAFAEETCCAKQARPCCSASMAPAAALTDKSLYQLTDNWTNDTGQTIKLASLAGRPQIVAMFFANCQYACPLLVYQMQQIEAALPETVRTNIGFVLVSFDTERDSVEALHNYRLQRGLDLNRWTLLRGSPDSVLDLAALLGVQFKKDARGEFLHSNLITLLNAQGEIAYQKTGLTFETEQMVQRVEGLAAR
jgi:protein SCO1/2